MTMQLAFEHLSPDADRLSFQERSRRIRNAACRPRPTMPHVDDLLFAVALVGLLALGSAELREGVDYALGAGAPPPVTTAAAAQVRG